MQDKNYGGRQTSPKVKKQRSVYASLQHDKKRKTGEWKFENLCSNKKGCKYLPAAFQSFHNFK
jgi:hypothetical protein